MISPSKRLPTPAPKQPRKEAEEMIVKLKGELDVTRHQLNLYQMGYFTLVIRLEEIKNNLIKNLQDASDEANNDLKEIIRQKIQARHDRPA